MRKLRILIVLVLFSISGCWLATMAPSIIDGAVKLGVLIHDYFGKKKKVEMVCEPIEGHAIHTMEGKVVYRYHCRNNQFETVVTLPVPPGENR